MRSIASLQGQCLLFARTVPQPMSKVWGPVANDLDGTVEHIAEFSLAGMKALGRR